MKYVEAIWNWRRACDHRGLSELERCRFNYQLLNLLLDDLMPWHNELYDFTYLEVNRHVILTLWLCAHCGYDLFAGQLTMY